jgi:hypothetical protein
VLALDDDDIEALLGEKERGADTDRAGADDGDIRTV